MLGCIHTQKPAASVKLVPFYYEAVVGQKDSLLAFICFGSFLFSYLFIFVKYFGAAESQCEFWLSFTAGLQPP